MAAHRIAHFRANITPPLGSPLCGGWITPVVGVSEPLHALGIVILGENAPIVLCAIDWCGIGSEDHRIWREEIARAAGTTPERVAVHCVHPHNAPLTDLMAQEILNRYTDLSPLMDVTSFYEAVTHVATAVQESLPHAEALTHVAIGKSRVEKVASNRRVMGEDGKVKAIRYSSCKDPEVRAAPEGVIDPFLKSVSFWNEDKKLAVLHYYATHPMSYYGDGMVTSDFAGLARERRTQEDDGAMHIFFTECGGNITAGKYNDGAPENRVVLMERIHRGMVEAEAASERRLLNRMEWRVVSMVFPPIGDDEELMKVVTDATQTEAHRKQAATLLSYRRTAEQRPILITGLLMEDDIFLLHLPGEPFVEYQLYAQAQRPGAMIAVAGFGDYGPGYIPLACSYDEGGYEPTAAFVGREAEGILKRTIDRLVSA